MGRLTKRPNPSGIAKYALVILVSAMMMASSLPQSVVRGSSSTASTSSSLTWETSYNLGCVTSGPLGSCWIPLDPHIAFNSISESILQNVYEPLLWYNGTSPTQIIPWLAKSYTLSADGTVASFVLRSNITFADGNPLNSSAVYFSLNRILFEDWLGGFGNGFGGPSWILQQLENTSLSSYFSGPQDYTQAWAERVLGQNFVEITGPLTFNLHMQNPKASFPYILAETWVGIVDPSYVMNHDIALWSASNSSYTLPYPALSGSLTNRMTEYFKDSASTCDTGSTPNGCGVTYLDSSTYGSLAGTGPYTIKSAVVNRTVVLQARGDYWGGPYQFLGGSRMAPHIQTIFVNNVPLQSDRTRDLTFAGSGGQAMIIDVDTSSDTARLFDVTNESDWINHGQLVSVLPNVTVFGPTTTYQTDLDPFETNVTAPEIGGATVYEQFQPFADVRFRLAFADSVDLQAANRQFNNNLGRVAVNAIPPGLPPAGSFNSSNLPIYKHDPSAAQELLLSAMLSPIGKFHFTNGTAARPGLFNNTFGCSRLDAENRCSNPVTRTMTLADVGGPADVGIFNQIAATINNISLTYNMGLQVNVLTVSPAQLFGNLNHYYMYALGWIADYPWVGDFGVGMFSPTGFYLSSDGWNVSALSKLWFQLVEADSRGDATGVVSATNSMNALANQMVLYLWTYYPYNFYFFTSNIQGFSHNPSEFGAPFVTLRIGSNPTPAKPLSSPLAYTPVALLVALVAVAVVGVTLFLRRRNKPEIVASKPEPASASASSTITVSTAGERAAEPQPIDSALEFEKPTSRAAFDYLVSSFIDDYMKKRLYSEQSGWRSLVQISQDGKIPQGALYGRGGNYGPVLAELQRRGLVEVRTFTGQRGRGGDVIKVRIAYDKEPVKQFVDKTAMKK